MVQQFKVQGIYEIWVKNTKYSYIGSSKNIENRFKQHCYLLRKKEHPNKFLQNCFNKYGQKSLILNTVEELPSLTKEQVLEKEKFWIEKLQPSLNIQQDPTNFWINNTGSKHGSSKITEDKISIIKGLLSQGLKTEEICNILDLSAYNDPASLLKNLKYNRIWTHVKEDIKYLTAYELTSPTKEKYLTYNLDYFKKEHGLTWESKPFFHLIARKIRVEHSKLQGWNIKVIKYPKLGFCYNKSLDRCKVSFSRFNNTKKHP